MPMREWRVYKEVNEELNFDGKPLEKFFLLTNVKGSDKFHWGAKPQWTTLQEDWFEVEVLGSCAIGSSIEEKFEDEFEKKYRVPKPMSLNSLVGMYREAPEGWVSPQGLFFPCHYGGHTHAAEYIARLLLGWDEDKDGYGRSSYSYLHAKGWVSVHSGMVLNDGVHMNGVTYSQKVMDTLSTMRQMSNNVSWADNYDSTVKRIQRNLEVSRV